MPLLYLHGVATPIAVEGTADEWRSKVAEKARARFVLATLRSDFVPGSAGFAPGEEAFVEPAQVRAIVSLADEE